MSMSETLQTSGEIKLRPEKKHAVMEIFGPTIQGEGMVLGMRTMFIRFGGCDYRCGKCDSLHAVLPELIHANAAYMTDYEIATEVNRKAGSSANCPMITFSGGNPCIHDLQELVNHLQAAGYKIAVETQGTIWNDWIADCEYVTISPKGPGMEEKFEQGKFESFLSKLSHMTTTYCVKVVIMDQRDLEFTTWLLQKYKKTLFQGVQVYLSLGNAYPPEPATAALSVSQEYRPELQCNLLRDYSILVADILKTPELSECIITPQFHVLLWGNKRGV